MFERILKMCDNVKKLNVNQIALTIWSDDDVRTFIIDLNTFEQMFKLGINIDGDVIGYYSLKTEIINSAETFTFKGITKSKIEGEHYQMYDSGDYIKSFNITILADGFIIGADDQKEKFTLTEKYGKKLLGLTNENIEKLGKYIIPLLQEKVREKILLND